MTYPRLPDAEFEIMKVVWQNGGGTTSNDVAQALKGNKDWAITTILHFLARLVDRGYLTVEKIGKTNVYTPLVAKADYLESEGKSLLERLYGNSLKDLVVSLCVCHPFLSFNTRCKSTCRSRPLSPIGRFPRMDLSHPVRMCLNRYKMTRRLCL